MNGLVRKTDGGNKDKQKEENGLERGSRVRLLRLQGRR